MNQRVYSVAMNSLLVLHGDLETAKGETLSEEQVLRLEHRWRQRVAEGRGLPDWVHNKPGLADQIMQFYGPKNN